MIAKKKLYFGGRNSYSNSFILTDICNFYIHGPLNSYTILLVRLGKLKLKNITSSILDKLHKPFFVSLLLYSCLAYFTVDNVLFAQSLQEAQKVRQQKLEREAQRALDLRRTKAQRFLLDWGGSERFYFTTYDDIDNAGQSDKRRTMKSNNFNLWGNLNLGDIHNFYVRFKGEHIDYNQGDQYRSTENQFHWNLEEGFDEGTYAISIDRVIEKYLKYSMPVQLKLTVGRFSSYIGSQLAFVKKGNGIQLDGRSKWINFKLFGLRNLIDEENVDFSVPGFRSSRRFFYGAEVNYNGFKKHIPYLFVLIQEDDSGENIEDLDQDYEYDSKYYGIGSRGEIIKNLYYEIEGIMETGRSFPEASAARGFSPDNEQIEAWAFDASLLYRYNILTHPNFRVEYATGSGDSDRAGNVVTTVPGNREGTTDRNFLNFGYIDTGFSMAPRISNLRMFKFGASFTPLEYMENRNVNVGVDFFLFRKDEKKAEVSDSRADRPQRNLGKEFDVNITWKIFSDLSASVDYGRFYPGNAYSDKDAKDYVSFTMILQF